MGRLQSYRLFLPAIVEMCLTGGLLRLQRAPEKTVNRDRREFGLWLLGLISLCLTSDDRDRYLSEREVPSNLLIKRIRKNGQDGRYAS